MTIPQPLNKDGNNPLDIVVMAPPPPNDNTDGSGSDCVCGHAKTDHGPLKQPEKSQPAWQCLHCGCTRAYPAWAPSSR